MRKHLSVYAFLLLLLPHSLLCLDASDSPSYINKFKDIAIREMNRSGIPASITLAQAIHESAWGNGQLATQSNNYFGIKCKDYWTGPTYYIEDDDFVGGKLIQSCFRAYDNVESSFVDHSDFLAGNPRYSDLFQYPITDYRSWAIGLQKCGYATDEKYGEKLIRTIEEYALHQFDTLVEPVGQPIIAAPPTVATAPRFNIGTYVPAMESATDISPAATPIVREETYDIPEAFVLPEDYQRGANRAEVSEPLILNTYNATNPGTPTPVVEQAINVYREEEEVHRPVEVQVQTPETSPKKQEAMIRMTYNNDSKTTQMSRQPRVSNNGRR